MPSSLLEKKPLVDEYLNQGGHSLSAFSFTSIFLWQDFFDFEFFVVDGNLCVLAKNGQGAFLYLPPLGAVISPRAVEESFERMEGINKSRGMTRIENVPEGKLSLFAGGDFSLYQKAEEYVYRRQDIADLKGNAYKSKRCAYNQFTRTRGYAYRPFEVGMIPECLALYDDWARNRCQIYRDEIYQQMIQENRCVHDLAMRYCKELGLAGRVVLVENKIRAYTFGHRVSRDVFCVLLEIADLDVQGLAVYIFREFCRDSGLGAVTWINVMDDFEMKNIAAVKRSFRPAFLWPVFTVKRK